MTAKISLRHVGQEFTVRASKGAASSLLVLDDFNLDVRPGEFLSDVAEADFRGHDYPFAAGVVVLARSLKSLV